MTWRLFLCLLIALATLATPAAQHSRHHGKSLKQLKGERASNRRKRSQLVRQKRRIEAKAHGVRRAIHTIDAEIGQHIANLAAIAVRLRRNTALEKSLSKELVVVTKKLAVRSEQARLRLRQIYMRGGTTLASAIVGSKSMSDIASRKFVFERIAQKDRELFEEVRLLRQSVVNHKAQVDRLIVKNRQDQEDERTEKAQLQDIRAEKGDALEDLKNQEGAIEGLIKELDQEDAEVMASIQSFEAGAGRSITVYHGRLLMPVFGARFSSGFGMRYHPILHRNRMHTGQDLAAGYGTPIHAAGDGVVIATRYMRGYGNAVIVDHGGGMSTLYGHCSRILTSNGTHVRRGDVIALVGSTGLATGPHCHFEVRINGRPVNPVPYIR